MDTSNLSTSQLNYLYQHGDYQLKSLVMAQLSATQMAQQFVSTTTAEEEK